MRTGARISFIDSGSESLINNFIPVLNQEEHMNIRNNKCRHIKNSRCWKAFFMTQIYHELFHFLYQRIQYHSDGEKRRRTIYNVLGANGYMFEHNFNSVDVEVEYFNSL